MPQLPPSQKEPIIVEHEMQDAAQRVVNRLVLQAAAQAQPLVVAIDGGSGAGKSTLARLIAALLGAALIPGDDFYAAEIGDAGWNARSAAERARDVIDWRRLRRDVLVALLAGRAARWYPFDFAAGTRPDGSYPLLETAAVLQPAGVIVLDGAYSGRPELADLVDIAILVDVPLAERHRRLAEREEAAFLQAWHARWDTAEAYYFGQVRPRETYDLIVTPGCEPVVRAGRHARAHS